MEKIFVIFDIQNQKTLGTFSFKEINKNFIKTLDWNPNDLNILDLIFPKQCFNPGIKNKENYDYSEIMVKRVV